MRGVAPIYSASGEGELVLNQKCIRDGWATTEVARWMMKSAASGKRRAQRNDVVVNSTGVGTLGRVAPLGRSGTDSGRRSHHRGAT